MSCKPFYVNQRRLQQVESGAKLFGARTILYYFDGAVSGDTTIGELLRAPDGRFLGAAYVGGTGYGGTVYEITP